MAKTIRTKPFLLATAGSTVDGRTIEDKQLKEMASSYDPKTYGARLNIEHIRGVSGSEPFNSYGDVVELSTGEVEVNFNGKTEKRLGLFGVFEVMENAKALNQAGQKLYPSIEIAPDFGGKGFSYLMGCALTDSPASIATERLQFNRVDPSRATLSSDSAAAIEFIEEAATTPAADGFFKKLTELLDGFKKTEPTPPAPAAPAAPAAQPADLMAQFTAVMEGMAKALDAQFATYAATQNAAITALTAKVDGFAKTMENTSAPNTPNRPLSTGPDGSFARTDC